MRVLGVLRGLLPERMPAPVARAFAAGPAKHFLPLYRMIAQEVVESARGILLDIGTGPGILPLEIARLGPPARVIGTDVSPEMIRIALENRAGYQSQDTEFLLCDAYCLCFRDQTADMIISTDALHHWKRPVRVLDEIYRCLKPGAQAWVYDGFSGASDEALDDCISRGGRANPFFLLRWVTRGMLGIHGFSRREYETTVKAIVGRSRFKDCVCEERGIMMRLCLSKPL